MDEHGEGWRVWRAVPWVAGRMVGVPIVLGFVALGAAVVVARSMRDVTREAWSRLPAIRRSAAVVGERRDSNAA
jgi:hypothetical protein